MDSRKIEEGLRLFLEGLDTGDAYVKDLPATVARDWPAEILAGYQQDPAEILSSEFEEKFDQLIVVKDIAFTSICCHHMVPFIGRAAVGYVPDKAVTGLSRLARLVDCFARRFQTQERMTEQIVSALQEHLGARGAACRIEAQQLCVSSRGPEKEEARIITTAFRGVLASDTVLKEEFLRQASFQQK